MTPALAGDAIRERVAQARVARLATISAEGTPDLVPVTFALVDDLVCSAVDDKPKRSRRLRRLVNIERDPRVTLLVDHYADDWTRLWWCALRGNAAVTDAPPVRAIEALRSKYEQYAEATLDGPFVVIAVTDWKGWTALG